MCARACVCVCVCVRVRACVCVCVTEILHAAVIDELNDTASIAGVAMDH